MSVSNGQPANQTTFNTAFMSRTNDTNTVGKVDLEEASTTDLIDTQRVINEALDASGLANQAATDANAKVYSSNNVVADGDDRKVAIGKLDDEFDNSTGHNHDGTNSAEIPDAGLAQNGQVTTGAQSFAGIKEFASRPTTNSIDIVDISSSQVITEKDIDGGTASNTSRHTLPKDTTANLDTLTDKEGSLAYDTTLSEPVFNDGAGWNQFPGAGGGGGTSDEFNILDNLGIDATVAASALTVLLTQSDGSSAPAADPADVQIGFRNSTAGTGGFNIRTAVSSISIVIPSGATLGAIDTVEQRHYIYALDNSGTIELAISGVQYDETKLQTTVALSGGSDDIGELYSTTLRASVPIRLIGYIESTQATAGTWATTPSDIFAGHGIEPEIIVAVYDKTSAQAVINGNTVTFSGKVTDTHNAFANGIFDIKKDGFVDGSVINQTASVVAAIGNRFQVLWRLNGTGIQNCTRDVCENTTSRPYTSVGSIEGIEVVRGDTIEITFNESIPAVNLDTVAANNIISLILR